MASSSSSSSSIPLTGSSITDDMLIEIFTYLPLNSICKFKCLSKVWLSNLSNPHFMTKWYQINKNSLPWIYYRNICYVEHRRSRYAYPELHSGFLDRNQQLFSFQFLLNEELMQGARVYAVGSSNGLVLCLSTSLDSQMYVVCNPLTHKWVSLPEPPSPPSEYDVNSISFEYSSSFASCYKVISIRWFDTPTKTINVDVFCSVLGVWETFEVSSDENVKWGYGNGSYNVVILNGALFWIVRENRLLVYNLNQNSGSDGHRFSLINLPEGEDWNGILRESEGRVCYAKIRMAGRKMTVSLWVLDEVNWKILHKDVFVGGILEGIYSQSEEDEDPEIIQVLSVSPVNLNVVLLGFQHRVWEFNMQTRSFEELLYLSNRNVDDDKSAVFQPFMLNPMPTVLPAPSWIDT